MKSGKDMLISWLNDAYGMETQLVSVLEHQVNQAKDVPMVQQKLQQHLEQTRRHADIVKGCVENLGGDVSQLKSGMSTLMGHVQGMTTAPAADTLIKDALSDFGAESFEVASYTSLIAAANELGEAQVATACQQILQEDQAMQQWILQNIPQLTVQQLQMVAGAGSKS